MCAARTLGRTPTRSHPRSISVEDLEKGCRAFEEHEGRDSMYRVATFLLQEWWGKHAEMVDALGVLLLTWNRAFYQSRSFDEAELQRFLKRNWQQIESYHSREIAPLDTRERPVLVTLFDRLNQALRIEDGARRGVKSPVSAAKALHLLAPRYFPLWDRAIANEYGCDYSQGPAEAYLRFHNMMAHIAGDLSKKLLPSAKSVLKKIDEYNYAKFTKRWI